jgi:hypothetical protein
MKKMWLVTVAVAALSLPAMAQNAPTQQPENGGAPTNQSDQMNKPDTQPQGSDQSGNPQDQMQQGSQANHPAAEQQASEQIDPTHLNKDQVKQIQQALDEKGIKTQADGIWGPKTANAVRKFQEDNKIEGTGHLTQETLAKLGVSLAGETPSETTGAAPSGNDTSPKASQPSTNQPGAGENDEKPMSQPDDSTGTPDQSK